MITIGEMQISGTLVMGLLALTLALQVPRRSVCHASFGQARWLMVAGLALMSVQFLLQYVLGLRQMGVTQAVFCNLLFFLPSCTCISQAILYLQRQGRLSRAEWSAGWVVCGVAIVLLVLTVLTDGLPLQAFSWPLRLAEYVCAGLFILIQGYYFLKHYQEYQRMTSAVDEYFDRERDDLLHWMDFLAKLLAVAALFLPLVIFMQGSLLIVFSAFYFFAVYYCAVSFYRYGISSDSHRVDEAQQSHFYDEAMAATSTLSATEAPSSPLASAVTLTDADRRRVERAAQQWAEAGNCLKPNLTLTTVAAEVGVQRYLLKAWLQRTDWGKLSSWLNHLRTEEAKRVMTEPPDWSLDSVASHCGFSTRNYFHHVFLEQTGTTPAKFQRAFSSAADSA